MRILTPCTYGTREAFRSHCTSGQRRRWLPAGAAVIAGERFLTAVESFVSAEITGLHETSVALIALEGFLAGVSPHVPFEVTGFSETPLTLTARVWLLSIVDPHVNSEVS